jgi:hypothetical protein
MNGKMSKMLNRIRATKQQRRDFKKLPAVQRGKMRAQYNLLLAEARESSKLTPVDIYVMKAFQ